MYTGEQILKTTGFFQYNSALKFFKLTEIIPENLQDVKRWDKG